MTYLPEDVDFSPEKEEYLDDINIMYRKIMQYTRLIRRPFEPTIYGHTTVGTVTYSQRTGWYIRHSNVVDYWFQVDWTNWVGGVGNIRLQLPSKIISVEANYFAGTMTTSNVSYSNALDTWCKPRGVTDENYAELISGRHNAAEGLVAVQATGGITGHIRYWSQENA